MSDEIFRSRDFKLFDGMPIENEYNPKLLGN